MFDTAVGVRDVVAQVRETTSELAVAARDCAAWTPTERTAALEAVRAAQAALAQARGFLLVADRDAGDTARPGDRSFEAALGRATRCGLGEASRVVRQADALVSMDVVAAGVRDLTVPLGHLDTIARVAAAAAPEVAAVLRTVATQREVVAAAGVQSGPDFAKFMARYVGAKDPASTDAAHEAQFRERHFTMTTRPHGVFLKGRLDVVAGETLRVALAAMGQFGDQTRTGAQARADALTLLAERVCAGTTPLRTSTAENPPAEVSDRALARVVDGGGGAMLSGTVPRPHLSLIVPAETVAELLTHQRALDDAATARDRGAEGGTGGARVCAPIDLPWGTVPPATLEDGTPVPMSELARALCDCEMTRIVMSAQSVPLDVGRTKRLFTSAQRKAAVVRDQQCIWNGCEQPAAHCEVHHIRWWNRDNGPTSLTNAALGCRHHHGEIHRLDLQIQRLEHPPRHTRPQPKSADASADGDTGDPTTPPVGDREPMRYVFRNRRGDIINAPHNYRTDHHLTDGTGYGTGDHGTGAHVTNGTGRDRDGP